MKTKKPFLFLTAFTLLSLVANAAIGTKFQDAASGLYFAVTKEDPTGFEVKVTGNSSFSGSAIIPATVDYSGSTYQVTEIDGSAFYTSAGLTSVSIPASVTYIAFSAFSECVNLTKITVSGDNKQYSSMNGVLFNADKTKLLQYPIAKESTSYTILSEVKTVGEAAFALCKNLEKLTILESVTKIESNAFVNCSKLKALHCRIADPATVQLEGVVFLNVPKTCVLYVPADSKSKYAVAAQWKAFMPNIAEEYKIVVAGIDVTSLNANDVLGNGTVSYYHPEKRLTLNNVNIQDATVATLASSMEGLKVRLIGTNTITNNLFYGMAFAENATITGTGILKVTTSGLAAIGVLNKAELIVTGGCRLIAESTYSNGYGISGDGVASSLFVESAWVHAKGAEASVGEFSTVYWDFIYRPELVSFSQTKKGMVDGNENLIKNEWIKSTPLLMGNKGFVTTDNYKDVLNDGTVHYDFTTKTLTLNNFVIVKETIAFGIIALLDNITIKLIGENKIKNYDYGIATDYNSNLKITGLGSLILENTGIGLGAGNITVSGGCKVYADTKGGATHTPNSEGTLTVSNANFQGISGNLDAPSIGNIKKLILNHSVLYNPIDAVFNPTKRCVTDASGEPISGRVVSIRSQGYPLKVAGIQVTDANKADILGNNTVSFDSSTYTLTLNGATINLDENSNGIETAFGCEELKIVLINNNTINGSNYKNAGIIGDGDFIVSGTGLLAIRTTLFGIFAAGNLKFEEGCSVSIDVKDTGIYCEKNIVVHNNKVRVKGNTGYSIQLYENLIMSESKITIPENGFFGYNSSGWGCVKTDPLGEQVKGEWVEIAPMGTGLETINDASSGIHVRGGKGVIYITLPTSPETSSGQALKGEYVRVYNLNGSLVNSCQIPAGHVGAFTLTPPSGGWGAGIYIVRIGNAAEKVVVW